MPSTFSSVGGFSATYSPPVTRISRGAGMIVAVLGAAPPAAIIDKTAVKPTTACDSPSLVNARFGSLVI